MLTLETPVRQPSFVILDQIILARPKMHIKCILLNPNDANVNQVQKSASLLALQIKKDSSLVNFDRKRGCDEELVLLKIRRMQPASAFVFVLKECISFLNMREGSPLLSGTLVYSGSVFESYGTMCLLVG